MPRTASIIRGLLMGTGACTAAFWILAAVIGSFFGAAAARHPLWVPSQLLHVLGALLVIPAIPELMFFARRPGGALGVWAGTLAMIGSALVAAGGVVALSVFPVIAANARDLLEPWGAMNRGAMRATWIAIAAVNMSGWILVGVALWKGRAPDWSVGLLLAGAVLANLPPSMVPLYVPAAGGLLWSAAILRFAADPAFSGDSDTAPMKRMRPPTPRSIDSPDR